MAHRCLKPDCHARKHTTPQAGDRVYKLRATLRQYGLTEMDYERQCALQDSRCAICGGPPLGKTRLSLDHDHVSGKLRGLLCDNCNRGLGMFHDDPARLLRAIDYLARFAELYHGHRLMEPTG